MKRSGLRILEETPMKFNEEKFVRSRHWFWLAVVLMFAGIIYMGTGGA